MRPKTSKYGSIILIATIILLFAGFVFLVHFSNFGSKTLDSLQAFITEPDDSNKKDEEPNLKPDDDKDEEPNLKPDDDKDDDDGTQVDEYIPEFSAGFEHKLLLGFSDTKEGVEGRKIKRLRTIGDWLCFVDDDGVWLTDDGVNILPCAVDFTLSSFEIVDYKYIVDVNGYVGLKDVFATKANDFIIEPLFEHIEFSGDTAIASFSVGDQTCRYLYYKGYLKGETFSAVEIEKDPRFVVIKTLHYPKFYDLSDSYVAFDEEYSLLLSDFVANHCPSNYVLFSVPRDEDGAFLFVDSATGKFGYACKYGILTEPNFDIAEELIGDCGMAERFVASKRIRIYVRYLRADDESGILPQISETILEDFGLAETIILPFVDGYAFFRYFTNTLFGVINSNFEIVVAPTFRSDCQTRNGYVQTASSFYSLKDSSFTSAQYSSISFHALSEDSAGDLKGYYICKNSDSQWELLDINASSLLFDDSSAFDYSLYSFGNFLLIQDRETYHLYEALL